MKRILVIALFLVGVAHGQVSNPSVVYQPTAPSGACSQAPPLRVANTTGAVCSCAAGTWVCGVPGAGGLTALSNATPDTTNSVIGIAFPDGSTMSTALGTGAYASSGSVATGNFLGFDDSNGQCSGCDEAIPINFSFINLLAPEFNANPATANKSFSGDRVADEANRILLATPVVNYFDNPTYIEDAGRNNATYDTYPSDFYSILVASISWLAIPNQYKLIFGLQPPALVINSGTYTTDNTFGPNYGLVTTTGGVVTATAVTPAKSFILSWYGTNTNTSSTAYSCTLGAQTLTGTLTTQLVNPATQEFNSGGAPYTITPLGIILTYTTVGTPVCTLTTTASIGNQFGLLYLGSISTQTSQLPSGQVVPGFPRVGVGQIPWTACNGADNAGNGVLPGTGADYNALKYSVVNALRAAGEVNVFWVPVRSYTNYTSDMSCNPNSLTNAPTTLPNGTVCPAMAGGSYGVHANGECGMPHWKDAFMAVLQPAGSSTANSPALFNSPPIYQGANPSSVAGWWEIATAAPSLTALNAGFTWLQSLSGNPNPIGCRNEGLATGYGTQCFGPDNGTYFNLGTYTHNTNPTLESSFTDSLQFRTDLGQMSFGLKAAPAAMTGYHTFNFTPISPTSTTFGTGGAVIYKSGNNYEAWLQGWFTAVAAAGHMMLTTDTIYFGWCFHPAGVAPVAWTNVTCPSYLTDSKFIINTPLNGALATFAGLAAPALNVPTTTGSGGTLPDTTQECYRILAVGANGGITAFPSQQCVTTGSSGGVNSVTITWTPNSLELGNGPSSYILCGRTTAAETFMLNVGNVLTYTDTGSVTPTALPAGFCNATTNTNTTGSTKSYGFIDSSAGNPGSAMSGQTTATPTPVTNMAWNLNASKNYKLECDIPVTFATTATVAFSITGPGTATSYDLVIDGPIGAAAVYDSVGVFAQTAYGTSSGASGAPGSAVTEKVHVLATIQNGTTASAQGGAQLVLNTIANGTNSITVGADRNCILTQLN
jgi:hypothetical protein